MHHRSIQITVQMYILHIIILSPTLYTYKRSYKYTTGISHPTLPTLASVTAASQRTQLVASTAAFILHLDGSHANSILTSRQKPPLASGHVPEDGLDCIPGWVSAVSLSAQNTFLVMY